MFDLVRNGFYPITIEMSTWTFGDALEGTKSFLGKPEFATSYAIPAVVAIVVIVIIIIIIVTVVQVTKTRPAKQLMGPVDLFAPPSPVLIDRATTKVAMAGTYTFSFYILISAVPDLRAGATPLIQWSDAWNLGYNGAMEELVWTMNATQPKSGSTNATQNVPLPTVPLQRWTQVTMTYEGRTIDLYVNGVLVTSSLLNYLVPPSTSSVILMTTGAVLGQIAYVQVWPRRLTVREVAGNYTDTSDSQGRPYLGPAFLKTLQSIPTALKPSACPSGNCSGTAVIADPSQVWEFPYA